MIRKPVFAKYADTKWAIGHVTASDATDPKDEHEENVMLAVDAVIDCFDRSSSMRRVLEKPQARFLLVIRAICECQGDGRRNEPMEREVSKAFMNHYGIAMFASMMKD